MSSDDPQHGDLPAKLVAAMQARSGKHPGHRTGHAKGILLEGHFTPSPAARTLSHAPHFTEPSTRLVARFSAGGGNPHVPDASDASLPKGLALRFYFSSSSSSSSSSNTDASNTTAPHTDIITHSYPGFHSRTGAEFHAFLTLASRASSSTSAAAAFDAYLAAHPAAREFVRAPKPKPASYGALAYYSVTSHVLRNGAGTPTSVRYRLVPADSGSGDEQVLDAAQAGIAADDYLAEELRARLPRRAVVFELQAQVAGADDVVDDATVPFKSARFVELGRVVLERVVEDNAARQAEIAFSPVPGDVAGVEPSNDPLLKVRADAYRVSVSQRRAELRAATSRL